MPSRHVEVEAGGRWWPGVQYAWRMYTDGTGWRAAVRFIAVGTDGLSSHDEDLPIERYRDLTPRPSLR